jgi:trehalose-6-phosphate synthase
MTTYCQGRIYPQSVPEFRNLQKADETMEMQVRYINSAMGYTGKWMPVNTVQESNNEVN